MPYCTCPVGSALTAIVTNACKFDISQIQKLMFQRIYSTGTTLNSITIATTNPNVLATWTALKAASDGTKVVVSPKIQNPTHEGGEPRTYGGGNLTLGGSEVILGAQPTFFQSEMIWKHQSVIESMKLLMCEEIGFYAINRYDQILSLADDNTAATIIYPIPITKDSFFIGDLLFGGFENPDKNLLRFSLEPDYSDELYLTTPAGTFSPLRDL